MNCFVQLTIDLLLPLKLCYLTGTHENFLGEKILMGTFDFLLSGPHGLPLKPIMVAGSFL